jgi:hypothetical protein
MIVRLVSGCLVIALFTLSCAKSVEQPHPSAFKNANQPGSTPARIKYQPVSLPPPKGWVIYRFPDEPDNSVLRCAAFSKREWQVTPEGEGVKISPYQERRVQDSIPFDIQLDAAADLAGDRHVKRVSDGWLVGYDAGEFGGALWWFGVDGSDRKKLSDDNVAGFADSSLGVLALVGLAHMGTDYGKVLLVREGKQGNRQVDTISDLGSAPTAFAMESGNSLIVATYDKIIRVLIPGGVEQILAPKDGLPYPNSLTLSKAGVIHVGMRHFVLRLSPAIEGYKDEWLIPSDCKEHEIRGDPCGVRMCMP